MVSADIHVWGILRISKKSRVKDILGVILIDILNTLLKYFVL